jgi:hypothetical protein
MVFMKTLNIRVVSIVATIFVQVLHASIIPVNLTCCSWANPLGIDNLSPRLSWQVADTSVTERSQSETAYEIQVASSAALLTSNSPDLWDTGEIISSQPFGVAYAGRTLTSVEQVFWRVRIWDVNSQASAWSPMATWTMGLLNATDWQGSWLVPASAAQTPLPIFRRQFTVIPGLQRALIFICGLGQYELSANGAKVGNAVLAPGWSMYPKTCLYDSLDITSYLTNGDNALGVMLGNGMYNVPSTANYSKFTGSFGPPKLIAQIYLFYTNGTSQIIGADGSWLTAPGPITYSHVYGGEYYDARLLPAGWNQPDINTSAWSAAAVTTGPGGVLRGQTHAAPPIVVTQTLNPVQTNTFSSSSFVYDLGQNAALLASLATHGPAGSTISIEPAELTNSNGTINRNSSGGGTAYWQYTLAGTGEESWTSRFFYHGCRYVQVTLTPAAGSSQLPTLDSFSGQVVQSAVASVGNFSCSSGLFNNTRNITRWAQRNNLASIITDCPTRERLGWLEQCNLHGPSLRYEFDCGLLAAKNLQDMTDSQLSSGLVPDIAPEVTVFSGGFRDSPEWGSSSIIVPWQHYLYTGDDSLLRTYYSTMTNYFAYLQNQSANNFLNYPSGLGDWYDIGPNPPGYSQDTPISLTADAYYCQDAQILAQAAAELGYSSDASRFSALATNIGTAFNNTYYSAANGYYATGSQTAQALPLYLGIVSPANQSNVLANLVANVNAVGLTSGEIGHRYLLRALTDNGRPDVVYALHSATNGPGYGDILSAGATSLTEAWDANSGDSQDHFMLGHITEWFYHDLAGIQLDPSAPGFQHVIIKPSFINGISTASASYNSVRGNIVSSWTMTNGQATLNVTIPVGATGSIYLPIKTSVTTNLIVQESGTTIWQNNAATSGATGVAFALNQGAGAQTLQVWNVGSGSYQFAWNVLQAPTGLLASSSNGKVVLNWNSVAGATGYNVKRSSVTGGGYVTIASVTGTNYTDASVTNNTTYYYVVSALRGGSEGPNSLESSATLGLVADAGFEAPIVGTAQFEYDPVGSGWTFSAQSGANGSGICANGSAFTSGNPSAPQGLQVAFLQGSSSISQTFTGLIAGASYQLSFYAAQRNNIYGQQVGQTWQVKIDGTVVGNYAPPESAQSYALYTASFTAGSSASHAIAFVGTDTNGGDNTIFIDEVNLTQVPQLIADAGFETPGVGTAQYGYSPAGSGWTFSAHSGANGAGICANGSGFNSGNPNAPQGTQVAFLQGTGSISQTFGGLIAGAGYQLSFFAAQRNNIYGQQLGQTWHVLIDGTVVGSYSPPESATNFSVYTASFTASPSSSHTLSFVGTDANGGDNTILIDELNLVQVSASQSIVTTVATNSPAISALITSGGQLTIAWPADHLGWQLQAQTSSLAGGIGTNWVTIPSSGLSTQFNCTLDPTLGAKDVLYRLVAP